MTNICGISALCPTVFILLIVKVVGGQGLLSEGRKVGREEGRKVGRLRLRLRLRLRMRLARETTLQKPAVGCLIYNVIYGNLKADIMESTILTKSNYMTSRPAACINS